MQPVLCTYCSRTKRLDEERLPAWQRYESSRIHDLVHRGEKEGRECFILSGKYGLIHAEQAIPNYDHLLVQEEVAGRLPEVVKQLQAHAVEAVEYHTADPERFEEVRPYRDLLYQACIQAGVIWNEVKMEGAPD